MSAPENRAVPQGNIALGRKRACAKSRLKGFYGNPNPKRGNGG